MYQYKLASNKIPKINCPDCHAKKHYQRYMDATTDEALPPEYGRCDNMAKCGYELKPPPPPILCYFVPTTKLRVITEKAVLIKQGANEQIIPKKAIFEQMSTGVYVADFFIKNTNGKRTTPLNISHIESDFKYFQGENVLQTTAIIPICKPKPPAPKYYVPIEVLQATLKNYENNAFIKFLINRYGTTKVQSAIEMYLVGTVDGYTSFPYIDASNNINIITLIEYGKDCKRNHNALHKNLHSYLRSKKYSSAWLTNFLKNESMHDCYFGEHLIHKSNKPIMIIEAPKTAFIMAIIKPQFTWLASGALGFLTDKLLRKLAGKDVTLYPDTEKENKAFDNWNAKATKYNFKCIDLDLPKELAHGLDLGDFALAIDYVQPLPPPPEPATLQTHHSELLPDAVTKIVERLQLIPEQNIKTSEVNVNYANNVLELMHYFENYKGLQSDIVYLGGGHAITNIQTFVKSHLARIETYYNKPIAIPYLQRLSKLKSILSNSL
jgi:hypothetical protein